MDRPTKCFLRNNLADFFQSLFAYVGYYIHLQIYIIEAHCCLTFKFVLLLHLYIFSQPIPLTFSTKRYKLLFTAAFYIICTSTLILFCICFALCEVFYYVFIDIWSVGLVNTFYIQASMVTQETYLYLISSPHIGEKSQWINLTIF